MKRKLLSAAISAIALGGYAQTSQATSYDLYLAGSSAQDAVVLQESYNLCASGFTYYQDSETAGANYKAYTCTIDSTKVSGLAVGDVVTTHKVNFGGSAQGVAPLFTNTAVGTLNINNGHCSTIASVKTPLGVSVPSYSCTTTQTNDLTAQLLDAGLSDVNPTLFQGVNQALAVNTATHTFSTFANVTSVPAGFTVVPATTLVWAVPVSLNLYKALQVAQGKLVGGCTLGAYSIDAVTAKDGACMPSLNKSELSSIISGAITDWSAFYFNGTSLTGAAAAYDSANGTSISPDDTYVNFCQRTPGSGTAAAQYAYFLNQPANLPSTSVSPAVNGVANVYSIADGGNMEKCLDDLSKGGNTAVDYTNASIQSLAAAQGAAQPYHGWAIGQQSSDKNATLGKDYRFVKINGVAPTLANAYTGAYDFTNESTWQYKTAAGSRAQQQLIVKQLIKNAQNPATIATGLNPAAKQQFGDAGFLGTVANALILNAAYTLPTGGVSTTYPVSPWTHTVGTTLDNGAFPVLNVNPATVVAP